MYTTLSHGTYLLSKNTPPFSQRILPEDCLYATWGVATGNQCNVEFTINLLVHQNEERVKNIKLLMITGFGLDFRESKAAE